MLKLSYSNSILECGTDEAGRGCLAGPVVAAAVILPSAFSTTTLKILSQINDSKQLLENTRSYLTHFIEENSVCSAVSMVEPAVIDHINILNASILAMQTSILKLNPNPTYIIIDGNRFSEQSPTISLKQINPKEGMFNDIPYATIVKGDALYLSIAAASILAKTYRDNYMNQIHEEYPMYNWEKNKGYPTAEHRAAIIKYGVTNYHRMSFRLLPKIIEL